MIVLFKKVILNYIEKNRKVIIGIVFCLAVGIAIGIAGYLFMDDTVKLTLNSSVRGALNLLNSDGYQKVNVIVNGVKSNLLFVFVLVLASITIIGIPVIYIMYIVKGIAIGIYICTIFSIFNFWNAILCILMLVIVVNIVYLPPIIYVGTNLLRFNNKLVESMREGKLVQRAVLEAIKLVGGFSIIFSSIILEDIFTKIVVKIYQNLS